MPSIDNDDDVFGSRYLSAGSTSAPRKSPSKQNLSLNGRKSSASLRGSSLADALGDDPANGRHSLAHELAAALLPEPSAGSKLLAEEFGIEYDEGAEGIDGVPQPHYDDEPAPQFAEIGHDTLAAQLQLNGVPAPADDDAPPDFDPDFRSPVASPTKQRRQPEADPMTILAQDLEYTEKFLAQLRHLDGDPSQPHLERLASDVIRRINDSARDRETQLRELLEYEREFRKIAGEVGGTEALAYLPELEDIVKEETQGPSSASIRAEVAELEPIAEDSTLSAHDWEVDPDRAGLGDEEDEYESGYVQTPVKTEFPPPPPLNGPPTPAATITLLAHLRTFTASTATSLATISEHTQVNAAATTEAGRKIRALKNKLGGWRTEWDSAERSRLRIERWEAGLDLDGTPAGSTPPRVSRRVDGRKIVQEHLKAFEQALAEANIKTQAIMAAVS
ncbi:hypothetical protein C8Q70DRAFT_1041949 [Cubamyces menziesii]|uniref:Uncharacterized protein n=1 Tax=Trametes cubensis TaxID=1111947 RepID=A0AAD7XBP2_9APHY|nr:hypothetical protein C8Q70DRAFT_1041949 [Cubamyces menziesii]KAJ8481643.1 hypothetical protein ONZ51_g5861 [Trametes cubensis]